MNDEPSLRADRSAWELNTNRSMNQPTPDPSQEGNCRCASEILFPSWEGSGVGWFMETIGC